MLTNKVVKATGQRTDCRTGVRKDVTLEVEIRESHTYPGEFWLRILNGVTGYESVRVRADINVCLMEHGWLACAGTEGRWDSLFVSASEMRNIYVALEVI